VTARTVQVTFDCHDPESLSRFWAAALGYVNPAPPGQEVEDGVDVFPLWHEFLRGAGVPESEWNRASAAQDPDGVGPRLFFQRVPEGKTVKNRLHLDVRVGTGLVGDERVAALEAECERLTALGASKVRLMRADGVNESCLVMQDPEGNEFCLD
jgi:hypothetical protein